MINRALRVLRQYHGTPPHELASHLSITREQLKAIELGHGLVNEEVLNGYSKFYDVPVSSLLLFSESIINESSLAKKIRLASTDKLLIVMEWLSNEKKKAQDRYSR